MNTYPYPRDATALQTLWDKSTVPDAAVFRDRWTVRMLTGSVPDFSWAGHCKDFPVSDPESESRGNNRVFGFILFGWFLVIPGSSGQDFLALDYSRGKHRNLILGPMRDHLRQVSPGVMLGAYYIVKKGSLEFSGWFGLEKKQEGGKR